MTIFYFTATGNSLAVAKRIGGTLISIPQIANSNNLHYKDDAIGIVFPIYWWNMPIMVRRFLDKVKLEADYLFAIGTYGSLPGAAMVSLQNQAKQNGHDFAYTNQVLMLDNYLPVFDMSKQEKNLPKKKVTESIKKIVSDIHNRKHMNTKANVLKKAMTRIFVGMFKPEKNALKYSISESCTKCGICAQVCPAKNISVTDKVKFNEHCEGCMACLHLCPKNALRPKKQKNDVRWRNPETSLAEIIESNNRT